MLKNNKLQNSIILLKNTKIKYNKKFLLNYKQIYLINYWKYTTTYKWNFFKIKTNYVNKITLFAKIIYFLKNQNITYNYIYIKSTNLLKYFIIIFKYIPLLNIKLFIYLNFYVKSLFLLPIFLNFKNLKYNIKLLKY